MRSFLLVALVAVAATAYPVTASSIEIVGLPTTPVQANGTAASLPFQVEVAVDPNTCAGGTSQAFTIALQARLDNATGPGTKAQVTPSSQSIEVGPTDTLQASKTYSFEAMLIVEANDIVDPLNTTVTVTATPSDVQCRIPAPALTLEAATAQAIVLFEPRSGGGDVPPTEEPVPGFGLPLAALALVGLAVLLRRRA